VVSQVLVELNADMQKCVDGLSHDLSSVRTGRASPALIEDVPVEYHGSVLPLKQLGNIAVPEPQMLTVQPWDRSGLRAIEKAILKANIGLNPSNDGSTIRMSIPTLNEERRIELGKMVAKRVEDRKVALRNIRRDYIHKLRQMEKDKEISQNDLDVTLKKVDEVTEAYIAKAVDVGKAKDKEIKEL